MNYNKLDSKLLMPTRFHSLQVLSNWKKTSYKQKTHSRHDQTRRKNETKFSKRKPKFKQEEFLGKITSKLKWSSTQISESPCNNFHVIR